MSALSSWMSLRNAPLPGAAVELAADHVSALSLDTRGGRTVVTAHATEALPEGALVPSLTAQNLNNRGAVVAALHRVLDQINRPRRVGLVMPDPVAKVSLVRFEQVPARGQDLDQLIRWQMRKAAPFPIEDAQVSYVQGARIAQGQEFIVTLARRDVILEYEDVCEAAGAYAGLVDISTFNVINAVLATGTAPGNVDDWLLVNAAFDYVSIAILRGADLIFFRSRGSQADESIADLVHQTAMYYEDRLQGSGFGRVMLAGASTVGGRQAADVEWLRRNLENRLAIAVETVDPREAVTLTDRISAAPALLDTLTPMVGLLMRGPEAAA
jgi:Tfp pilus assembly PilM family ATPase